MTHQNNNTARLTITRRQKGEVMQPRPVSGDHKQLVRSATAETIIKNHKLFAALASI